MKVVITLFLSVLMATSAFSFPFQWFGKNFAELSLGDRPKLTCNDVNYWQKIVDKAKEEHPSADIGEMVKLIVFKIMNDSSHPMFAIGQIVDEKSRAVTYGHFDLNLFEAMDLFNNNVYLCEMKGNLTLGIILKKETTTESFFIQKWKNLFFYNQSKINEVAFNTVFKKDFSQHLKFATDQKSVMVPPKCNAKVQAIVDKVDNMTLSTLDEWTRKFSEEFKTIIKPLHVYITNMSITEASYICEGDEPKDNIVNCSKYPVPETQKCHTCQVEKGDDSLVLIYLEH